MEFKNTIYARRSNRFLLNDPLKEEEINYILEIAKRAPIALGKYDNLELLVLKGNTLKSLQEELIKVNGRDNTFGGAALIVVLHKGEKDDVANQDAAIVAEHMCLAAADINIGNVYLHSLVDLMNSNEFISKQLLDIEKGYKVMCAVTLGYKANDNVRDITHDIKVKMYD